MLGLSSLLLLPPLSISLKSDRYLSLSSKLEKFKKVMKRFELSDRVDDVAAAAVLSIRNVFVGVLLFLLL